MSAVMVAEGTNAFDTMVVEGRTVNVTDMVLSHAGSWRYASLSGILLDLPGLERLSLTLSAGPLAFQKFTRQFEIYKF